MTDKPDFSDMTLDELRVALAPEIAASAILMGGVKALYWQLQMIAGLMLILPNSPFPKSLAALKQWI